jgi:hypothetical protein
MLTSPCYGCCLLIFCSSGKQPFQSDVGVHLLFRGHLSAVMANFGSSPARTMSGRPGRAICSPSSLEPFSLATRQIQCVVVLRCYHPARVTDEDSGRMGSQR